MCSLMLATSFDVASILHCSLSERGAPILGLKPYFKNLAAFFKKFKKVFKNLKDYSRISMFVSIEKKNNIYVTFNVYIAAGRRCKVGKYYHI